MKLLIFKTDIQTEQKVAAVQLLFNSHAEILDWTIDLEDIDKVLRIEAAENICEEEVISLVENQGFLCDYLSD